MLAKVIIKFLKENNLYMKYYNFFAINDGFKNYIVERNGLANFIRDRIKDDEDILDFDFLALLFS